LQSSCLVAGALLSAGLLWFKAVCQQFETAKNQFKNVIGF
jgi:hypothetical protein